MRPYGLPRNNDVSHPDSGDMHFYGLKASKGHLRGKGGDFRSYQKSKAKARARRYWKKRERRRLDKEMRNQIER